MFRIFIENVTLSSTVPTFRPRIVACTCDLARLDAEFGSGLGSIPVGGSSPSIGGLIV